MKRLAFLVQHPTQFEVPFYKYQHASANAGKSDFFLDVYYLTTASVSLIFDRELGRPPGWDFDEKEGYRYVQVPLGKWKRYRFLFSRLTPQQYPAIIINGYVRTDIWFHLLHARLKGIPLVLRLDSVLLYQQNSWKKAAKNFLLPPFFRFFDAFLAVGSLTRQALMHYGVPAQKIFLFPYAVDNDRFALASQEAREHRPQLRDAWGLPRQDVVFIAVVKFVPREGVFDLLNAFALLQNREPNAVLLLVGDGPQKQAVLAMIEKERLTNVVWVGYQPYSQLPILYGISDVFIHPAHQECWGVSVNEAMACGLPIILSDMVGSGADLLDGNGMAYKAGNVAELAACIISLTQNHAGRKLISQRSLEIIEK